MIGGPECWLQAQPAPGEPTLVPVVIEPSPPGADDTARLLGIATFNGLCRLLTALAARGLLCREELRGIEDVVTTPLDDPEWRDDGFIAALRDAATSVAAQAMQTAVPRAS